MKRIGVLALQGAFAEHISAIEELGAKGYEIRNKTELLKRSYDGIILPGGESTVIGKLLYELDMMNTLRSMLLEELPVFGTCAGLILLAKEIKNEENRYLQLMDINVKRNAYGRQLGSFATDQEIQGIGVFPMVFIRAPYIESLCEEAGARVMARIDNKIVAARQKNMLVTSFHPELTKDLRIHKYFLNM